MSPIKIGASLSRANLGRLEDEVRQLEAAGIDYLHMDIMDGRFVPNFCFDFDMMHAMRRLVSVPQDVHLMVVEPERYVKQTVEAGAKYVTIHYEATYHVQRVLQQIRDAGAKPGIALSPATPLTTLEYILDDIEMLTIMTVNPGFGAQKPIPAMFRKIHDARTLLDSTGHNYVEIQVDGSVGFEHIPAAVAAGATVLVGGTSSVFRRDHSIAQNVAAMREMAKEVEARL